MWVAVEAAWKAAKPAPEPEEPSIVKTILAHDISQFLMLKVGPQESRREVELMLTGQPVQCLPPTPLRGGDSRARPSSAWTHCGTASVTEVFRFLAVRPHC